LTCVNKPRIRLPTRVTSPAKSSSNPTITSKSARASSSVSTRRSACGIDRAASAMT